MKRPSCLYIHIGPHKTGSSAIQRMCDENRANLAERAILYPQGRWHGQLGSYFARNKLGYIYNQHSGNIDLATIQASDSNYMETLTHELTETECDNAVVSYEGFIALNILDLTKFRNCMSSFFDSFRVIGYCRHPISFAPSEISQRARMGAQTGRQRITDLPIPKFREYFEKFASVFGIEQMMLTEFAPHALHKGDVRFDFLKKIGVDDFVSKSFRLNDDKINESLSFEAVIIAEALARQMPSSVRGNLFFLKFHRLLASIKGMPITLTEEERNSVMERAQPHLKYIQETFGIKLKPPEKENVRPNSTFVSHEAIGTIASNLGANDPVSQGYRWLLGREPESEDVIFQHLRSAGADWRKVRAHIMLSPEFRRSLDLAKIPESGSNIASLKSVSVPPKNPTVKRSTGA